MRFDQDQRAIATSAALALALTAATLVAAGALTIFAVDDWRHVLAIAATPLAIAIIHDVGRLARHRFFEPLDRHAAAADTRTAKAEMLSAILRNTHEQVTLAALVYGIAAVTLPAAWTDAIIGCAILFLIGRLVFAACYASGAGARAFGFGLTFYPTVALALLTGVIALL